MPRALKPLSLVLPVLLLALAAAPAWAQSWPTYPLDPAGSAAAHTLDRGPGWYLSLTKIILSWLVFAAWVKTTDWLSGDCLQMRMNYVLWNSVVFFAFLAAFLLLWLIPLFPLGFVLLLAAYGGPLGAYIYQRNAQVEPHQRVLTKDHLRHLAARPFKKAGIEIKDEETYAHQKGAPVEFRAQGGATDRDNTVNLLTARQSPGFLPAKELIDDMAARRAEAVLLDYTQEAVAVRYQIDGVWHNHDARDRESGDAMLVVFKTLAALNPADRRQKQEGAFQAETRGRKFACHIASQGVQTGERVAIRISDGKTRFRSLEELGMREKLREQLLEQLRAEQGFVLLSAMPGGGLTSLFDAALEESDRLMRNYVAVEEAGRREGEIENVEITTYSAAAGETPVSVLPGIIRKYPDVLVLRELPDAETVQMLCDQVGESRLVLGGIRAKEAPEALLRVLMLKVSAQKFARAVTAVVNQRLIRMLCPACKVAYPPSPEVLQKLGIPAGRVEVLYREPLPEEIEENKEICAECGGLGYKGRTALFELLVVDDKVREVLIKQPKLDLTKKAARLAGMRSLQEEGILLVAKGVTSLPELMRVLKT